MALELYVISTADFAISFSLRVLSFIKYVFANLRHKRPAAEVWIRRAVKYFESL